MNAKALKLATLVVLATTHLLACGEDDAGTASGTGGQGTTNDTSSKGGSTQTTANGSGGNKTVTNTTTDKSACVTEAAATPATTSAEESCEEFCVAEDHCKSETDVEACIDYRRCGTLASSTTACQAAAKVFWDCMRAQNEANICVEDLQFCCGTQAAAASQACATD